MKSKKIIPQKIKISDTIQYNAHHKEYGRAEFDFCPIFEKGYMTKLYIYRRQQEPLEAFVIDIKKDKMKINSFMIESWIHKTEHPRVWRNYWCKEHDCVAFEVYVPNNTHQIVFEYHFGDMISIRLE